MIPALPAAAGPAAPTSAAARPAGRSFTAVLDGLSGPAGPTGRSGPGSPAQYEGPAARPAAAGGPCASTCVELLEVVDRARARLDGVLAAARSGRTFTAQELLGLQAEAYRTVQAVDLGAKLVEQAAQAVRQTLATQV
jgi:hypothetical protein